MLSANVLIASVHFLPSNVQMLQQISLNPKIEQMSAAISLVVVKERLTTLMTMRGWLDSSLRTEQGTVTLTVKGGHHHEIPYQQKQASGSRATAHAQAR